jgi:hypothetical protein
MTPREEQIRGIAADIVEECGPYARMAALFLAGERREDGDDEGTIPLDARRGCRRRARR